jgi:hypothetical protein
VKWERDFRTATGDRCEIPKVRVFRQPARVGPTVAGNTTVGGLGSPNDCVPVTYRTWRRAEAFEGSGTRLLTGEQLRQNPVGSRGSFPEGSYLGLNGGDALARRLDQPLNYLSHL